MKTRHKHESYGMVSIGRTHSNGKVLFGSGVKHNNTITIEVHEAEKESDEFSSHYFSKKMITRIELSPSQFTGLLTNIDTTGVPCTLNYVKHEGRKESPPDDIDTMAKLLSALELRYKKLADQLKYMKSDIDMFLEGNVKVGDKKNIKYSVNMMIQEVEMNIPYLSECQIETLEKVGAEMVAEVESSISGLINSKGLQALKHDIENKNILSLD